MDCEEIDCSFKHEKGHFKIKDKKKKHLEQRPPEENQKEKNEGQAKNAEQAKKAE